jgi:hypothetical protein
MNDDQANVRPSIDEDRSRDLTTNGRRAYVAPALVEYGTVAKLTQTGGGSVSDFGNMMRMACL